MGSSPTRLGRLARPTVTSANRHHKKYEVKKPKLGSFLTTQIGLKPKDCIFLVKLSRYSVCTSTVFNGVVPNKVR